MIRKIIVSCAILISTVCCVAQQSAAYADSLTKFIHQYVENHDVIKNDDKQYFRFFPPDEAFLVNATFKKTKDARWFQMESSGPVKKTFRVYGVAAFSIHDTVLTLTVYQSQNLMTDPQYRGYLFLPFTDLTTGNETYHTGRYLDFDVKDIKNDHLVIDFNKAYNPSCAYVDFKYNCPVPPRENNLPVSVRVGEMNFGK